VVARNLLRDYPWIWYSFQIRLVEQVVAVLYFVILTQLRVLLNYFLAKLSLLRVSYHGHTLSPLSALGNHRVYLSSGNFTTYIRASLFSGKFGQIPRLFCFHGTIRGLSGFVPLLAFSQSIFPTFSASGGFSGYGFRCSAFFCLIRCVLNVFLSFSFLDSRVLNLTSPQFPFLFYLRPAF